MKKYLALLIAVCILFTAVPVYAEEAGWHEDSNGWKYVDEDGNYIVSDWVIISQGTESETRYYIDENGYMVTGFRNIDGNRYFFDGSGIMHTSWLQYGGQWYYFDDAGRMVYGWLEYNQNWYYMGTDGVMLTGWQRINGEWEYFAVTEENKGQWREDNSAVAGTIMGIDVSYWQGDIDWDAVKAEGVGFTFIRVGHGARKLDTKFERNISEANRVGIPAGVYFYSTAQTVEESILDAQFVIDSVQGYTISYPIVIDVEDASQQNLGKQAITDIIKAFCEEIEEAGYTAMVYCNENWYRNYIDFEQLGDVERWIARYAQKTSVGIERDIWQAGSTTRMNGIEGNVDIDFAYTDYSKIVTPRTECLATYEKTTGYWKEDSNGSWYQRFDGSYPVSQWEEVKGFWYYFDANGYLVTNQWFTLADGTWRYVNENGASVEGWNYINNNWYYFDSEGIMQTGWENVNGTWYYLGAHYDGTMKTGWQFLGNTWYYFEPSGAMKIGWVYDAGNWYLMDANGAMETGWGYTDNTWYFFDAAGVMQTGWQYLDNTWYYFGESWDGAMKTGWQYLNGNWYYLGGINEGGMRTGWQWIDNNWYYLGDQWDGAMKTGWLKDGNEWYYLGTDGAMKTGWQVVNGKSYYLYGDGTMAKSTWVDKWYVNEYGVWTESR